MTSPNKNEKANESFSLDFTLREILVVVFRQVATRVMELTKERVNVCAQVQMTLKCG